MYLIYCIEAELALHQREYTKKIEVRRENAPTRRENTTRERRKCHQSEERTLLERGGNATNQKREHY
jgi:hypothetical protein